MTCGETTVRAPRSVDHRGLGGPLAGFRAAIIRSKSEKRSSILNPARNASANGAVLNLEISLTDFDASGTQNQPMARPAMPPRPSLKTALAVVIATTEPCCDSPNIWRMRNTDAPNKPYRSGKIELPK